MKKNKNTNEEIVDKFFDAYKDHDMNAIRKVMADNVVWYFQGQNPAAGIKSGIDEVIPFFDSMRKIMTESNGKTDKLIVAENDRYFIECQRSKTNREDGNNLEHYTTVLWTIEDGKIIEGRHFFADPPAVDKYFSALLPSTNVPKKNVFHG